MGAKSSVYTYILPLSLAQLCMLGFLMLALSVRYGMISFILECDDNMLCLLCAYCLACFTPPCVISMHWLYPCMLVCLAYACFCLRVHTHLYPRNPETYFQKLCLLAHLSSIIQFNGSMDAKSKPTFVPCEYIVSLIICFLTCSLCLVCLILFACLFACFVVYD